MTVMMLSGLQKEALKFVNARRKEGGLKACSKLSKGYPRASQMNTIVKSLEKVGVDQAIQSGETVWLASKTLAWRRFVEPEVAKFMRAFDEGQFPDLEIPMTPVKVKGKVV